LDYSLQQQWTNKFSANITVANLATTARVYDARTLHKGDELQITNYFGNGFTAVQENSEHVFTLMGSKFGTTAVHTWEFVPLHDGTAMRLIQREAWTGGMSFLFMKFGPVRPLLVNMFTRFNLEVKENAEGVA
jgi:hypothetical protein